MTRGISAGIALIGLLVAISGCAPKVAPRPSKLAGIYLAEPMDGRSETRYVFKSGIVNIQVSDDSPEGLLLSSKLMDANMPKTKNGNWVYMLQNAPVTQDGNVVTVSWEGLPDNTMSRLMADTKDEVFELSTDQKVLTDRRSKKKYTLQE